MPFFLTTASYISVIQLNVPLLVTTANAAISNGTKTEMSITKKNFFGTLERSINSAMRATTSMKKKIGTSTTVNRDPR